MSMTKEVIKKFVEEDYKDHTILVTCDNEHKFFHRSYGNPSIIWDWDNNTFTALEITEDIVDQSGNPMQVTTVSLDEIQFLTAYIDMPSALEFANTKYTDDKEKEKVKGILQKVKPAVMDPRSLKKFDPAHFPDIQY